MSLTDTPTSPVGFSKTVFCEGFTMFQMLSIWWCCWKNICLQISVQRQTEGLGPRCFAALHYWEWGAAPRLPSAWAPAAQKLSSPAGNRRPSTWKYQTCVGAVDRLIAPTVVCKTWVNILIFLCHIWGKIWKQKIECLVVMIATPGVSSHAWPADQRFSRTSGPSLYPWKPLAVGTKPEPTTICLFIFFSE